MSKFLTVLLFSLFYRFRVCHEFNFRVCLFFLYRATHRLFWNGIFSGVLCQISWLFLLLFVLGILVKRSAFALGFLLVWNIIEGIAKGILSFKIFPDNKTADYITQFFPLESMSNLIVEPFLDCLL
jgi:hypothetical protein